MRPPGIETDDGFIKPEGGLDHKKGADGGSVIIRREGFGEIITSEYDV